MHSVLHLQQQPLFRKGEKAYRIPALLYLSQSSEFLAFAEERADLVDEHAERLVVSRGRFDNDRFFAEWDSPERIASARLPDHRSMNPCPIYDRKTQTIFLFFIAVKGTTSEAQQINAKRNATRLCYVTSMDMGKTWSSAMDLTEPAVGQTYSKWATFAIGPGHGVQLQNSTESLVVPAYAYWIHSATERPKPKAFCFISHDHGKTWSIGHCIPNEYAVECQMASIEVDGKQFLYCNARSLGSRVQAVSHDGGGKFEKGHRASNLVEPPHGCQGSIVGFPEPGPSQAAKTWMLFSHPTDENKRRDLGIYLNQSPRDHTSWTAPIIIHHGPCAYSDLQYLGLNSEGYPAFACLFECGKQLEYEEIAFVLFTLKLLFPALFVGQ
uniref:exo-alpha-sialidase n=1 Tax=Latimeria chalumnae TaxID=7897 RepID=H3AXU1_LATCH